MKILKDVKNEPAVSAFSALSDRSASLRKHEQNIEACASVAALPEDVLCAVFDQMSLKQIVPLLTLSKSVYPVVQSSMKLKKEEFDESLARVVRSYLSAFDSRFEDDAPMRGLGEDEEKAAIDVLDRHGASLRSLSLEGVLNHGSFKYYASRRADGRDQGDALVDIFQRCSKIETLNLARNYLLPHCFECIDFSLLKNLLHLNLSNSLVNEKFFDKLENSKVQSLMSFTCNTISLSELNSHKFTQFTTNQKNLTYLDVSFMRCWTLERDFSIINLRGFLTQPHASLEVVKLRAGWGSELLSPLAENIWPSLKKLERQETGM